MLIEFNLQDGPILMFAIAVVIVAVIFLVLAGAFAVAETAACFFEKIPVAPRILSWHLACAIVFLVNLGIAASFPFLVEFFDLQKSKSVFNLIVDAPFYVGIPVGLAAMALFGIIFSSKFNVWIVSKIMRVCVSLLSAVTVTYFLNNLLLFMRSFDFMGIIRTMIRIMESDLGFYLINGLLILGFFVLNFKRLKAHAKFLAKTGSRTRGFDSV